MSTWSTDLFLPQNGGCYELKFGTDESRRIHVRAPDAINAVKPGYWFDLDAKVFLTNDAEPRVVVEHREIECPEQTNT